ncbi:MAG: hypothetical protein RLZZ324_1362 [Candidatus Parcubacteria bacterium]
MAAGLGTRMRPLTDATPKPMLHVNGRPILERTISLLPPEVTEVILVVGYLQDRIRAHFGASWGGKAIRYVEQNELRGSAHAVHLCRPHIQDRFVVLNGDDLYAPEDVAATAAHRLAVLGMQVDDGGRFGMLETDADGHLTRIAPDGSVDGRATVNIGVYALDKRFFDYPMVPVKSGKEFGLPQTIGSMAPEHAIKVTQARFWMPIGYPEDIARAEAALAAQTADTRGI